MLEIMVRTGMIAFAMMYQMVSTRIMDEYRGELLQWKGMFVKKDHMNMRDVELGVGIEMIDLIIIVMKLKKEYWNNAPPAIHQCFLTLQWS